MNSIHLHNILTQYVERYDELNNPQTNNEGYKWKAEECFKKHWNIDAEDFPSMFKNAFKDMSNLIDNKTVQPVGGIQMLLGEEKEVEFVRECFKELYCDDNGDVDARQDRIEAFIDKINSRIDVYANGSWKYPQQRNNVIYYLNLWKPEENYIFKASVANEWANCIEFGDDFGSGNSFSLKKYYKMCDELLEELNKNETIMKLYNERMKNVDGFDDKGHILVYDVIYCAKAYDLYKNVPSLTKLTTKQRIKLAETAEKREYLLEKYTELSAELEELAKKLVLPVIVGETVSHLKWGKGTVASCGNGVVEVEFAEGIKKFQFPDSINKFLKIENKACVDAFDEFMENTSEQKALEADLSKVMVELESYKN